MVFLPLAAACVIACLPQERTQIIRCAALLATGLVLGMAVCLICRFNTGITQMQFVEIHPWIPFLDVQYHLGIDGLSIALVFLTALLGFLACVASSGIVHRVKEYYIFYLLLMVGMMGTFVALDLVLFYVFWELVLVPMYFLIGIWGGPRRQYAAIKFFLYTLVGSLLMLVAILVLYFTSLPHTFNMLELAQMPVWLDLRWQILVFLGFYVAFAIKVPVFPFHTWLPDAHVEAPTPVSVLLAGVLLKMGGYGFFRIAFPILRDAAQYFLFPIAVLAVINIVYGACVAMAQRDFKKMIAYSSVSHMGFVMLGLASMSLTGFNGAFLEMFNHGIITGALFLLVGVLYDRAHTRDLDRFGGIGQVMPVYGGFLSFFALASLGLPGLSGFVGELMALIGAFAMFKGLTIVSIAGLVFVVALFLSMLQRVLMGKLNSDCVHFSEIGAREVFTLVPLMAVTVMVGFYPMAALQFQDAAVKYLLKVF